MISAHLHWVGANAARTHAHGALQQPNLIVAEGADPVKNIDESILYRLAFLVAWISLRHQRR
jgi:hypothetical protein